MENLYRGGKILELILLTIKNMAVISQVSESSRKSQIRPINPRRDLGAVADLIELCFSETLDDDGKQYLKRMRRVANKARNWFDSTAVQVSVTTEGFIWEENGQIVGNISLIPFGGFGRPIYLIANVAVHPDQRRRGIARALTDAALAWTEKRKVRSVWLQVREENQAALNLYQASGFSERARRTTWNIQPGKIIGTATPQGRIVSQKSHHWKSQRDWLRQNYPDQLFWYWPTQLNAFRPGIVSMIANFISDVRIRHWGVERDGKLMGLLSWKTTLSFADQLWLAAPPENENIVLNTLLPFLYWRERAQRPLSIELPKGRAAESLLNTGFAPSYTLIWMELDN